MPSEAKGCLAVVAVVLLILGIIVGATVTRINWKDKAINAGVGEFYLDEENHRQFRWKEQSDED